MEEEEIINRVAGSNLVNLNLDTLLPDAERVSLDLAPVLHEGLLLREKDLRAFAAQHDWEQYRDKMVAVYCSADAIIPTWAFMLLAVYLEPVARKVVYGTPGDLLRALFTEAIEAFDAEALRDKKVLVHGCGQVPVPESAFVEMALKLRPVVQSLMFGEACSTVPLYKRKGVGSRKSEDES